jgi:hypothetical protein
LPAKPAQKKRARATVITPQNYDQTWHLDRRSE